MCYQKSYICSCGHRETMAEVHPCIATLQTVYPRPMCNQPLGVRKADIEIALPCRPCREPWLKEFGDELGLDLESDGDITVTERTTRCATSPWDRTMRDDGPVQPRHTAYNGRDKVQRSSRCSKPQCAPSCEVSADLPSPDVWETCKRSTLRDEADPDTTS